MNRLICTIILWLIGLQSQGAVANSQADFLQAIASGKVTDVREMLDTDPSLANANAPGALAILYADRSIKGMDGKTALDVAAEAHLAKIQEILSEGKI